MRFQASIAVLMGAASLLAACSKPAGQADQSATPPASAEAPTPVPTPLTEADKKAALAALPVAYQTSDLDNGQAKFALCKSCHTTGQGEADMTGPNLFGVFGRKAGSKPGFSYSDALKGSKITWDAAKIDQWITSPRTMVPGTKMTYLGTENPKDRVDIVAYLKVETTARGKS